MRSVIKDTLKSASSGQGNLPGHIVPSARSVLFAALSCKGLHNLTYSHRFVLAGQLPPHTAAFTMPGLHSLAGRIITSHVQQSSPDLASAPLQVLSAVQADCCWSYKFSGSCRPRLCHGLQGHIHIHQMVGKLSANALL